MEEEKEGRRRGEDVVEGVLLNDFDGGEGRGGGVGGVDARPMSGVGAGDAGEGGIEFDADDFAERILAGDEQAAAFAGADVDEGVAGDGVGRDGLAPLVDEGAQNAGRDAIVGGDVLVVGVAGDEMFGGNQTAGVDAVHLVEGMDGELGEVEQVAGTRARGNEAGRRLGLTFWRGEFGFGRGHLAWSRRADSMVDDCRGARGPRG